MLRRYYREHLDRSLGFTNLLFRTSANLRNAFYSQTTPDSFGFIANPYGFGYRDLGMGTFLRRGFGSAPNPNRMLVLDANWKMRL